MCLLALFPLLLFFGCSHLPPPIAEASPFRNPFARLNSQKRIIPDPNFECPPPPIALVDVPGVSYYSDNDRYKTGHYSVIDPEKHALRKRLVKPLSEFNACLSVFADTVWEERESHSSVAHCAESWLYDWAVHGALLGSATEQGVFERSWTLSGAALAYLRLKPLVAWDPGKQQKIEAWLVDVASLVRKEFSGETKNSSRRNNLADWAALGVLAASIATKDSALYGWSVEKLRAGIEDVNDEGFLPLELMRGKRALHYHSFALQPLMMSAFLAQANDTDLFLIGNGALHRLAKAVQGSYRDPTRISRLAKVDQEVPNAQDGVWLEIYHFLFPEKVSLAELLRIQPAKEKWLGGNLTEFFSR